jgi:diguanylate cyclase (GGDEF)-like protein
MAVPRKIRFALFVACACCAGAAVAGMAITEAPVGEPADQLLQRADSIKTSNHAGFVDILKRLDDASVALSPTQQTYLHYLKAWQLSYAGDYAQAIAALNAIIAESIDPALRFRAGITLANTLVIAKRYEEGYASLSSSLDLLPKVSDNEARRQGLGVAAFFYNEVGQYELGIDYADKAAAEIPGDDSNCKSAWLKATALYKIAKSPTLITELQNGVDACVKAGDPVFANLIRAFVANVYIEQRRAGDAIKLLKDNYADAQRTRYARLTSEFDSILAQAYWKNGHVTQAQEFAQSAIDKGVKGEVTKPIVEAYQVLYQVAQKQGDYRSALAYYEQYAAADKGYLNDASARAMAYEMVKQQVISKKRQIDGLTEKNKVLQLQQEVAAKSAETQRLYFLLLMSVLCLILLWAYRTKLSQLRFRRLSRSDSLTGILNRQHFMDQAKLVLQESQRSAREVCLLLIDLDNFKAVNDSQGHVAGDAVLQCTAAVLQMRMRAIDVFGRLGGEEFGVVLPGCGLNTARQRAEDLREAIGSMDRAETSIPFDVSASFGVACTSVSGYDLRQLLIHADSALYGAKRGGRNRVETYAVPGQVGAAAANPFSSGTPVRDANA